VARFKAGSFMLAIEAGLPVVPLSIVGTRFVMRKGRLAVAPGDVTLAIHAPIDTAGRAGTPTIDDARALAGEVHAIISGRVEALERERGTWPSP
jgi:1-acyl-sn-glycerol-3-phosphate acyltransferase